MPFDDEDDDADDVLVEATLVAVVSLVRLLSLVFIKCEVGLANERSMLLMSRLAAFRSFTSSALTSIPVDVVDD